MIWLRLQNQKIFHQKAPGNVSLSDLFCFAPPRHIFYAPRCTTCFLHTPVIVEFLSCKIWQISDKSILLIACKGMHLLIRSYKTFIRSYTIKIPLIRSYTIKIPLIRSYTIKILLIRSYTIKTLHIRSYTIKILLIRSYTIKILLIRSYTIKIPLIRSYTTKIPLIRSYTIKIPLLRSYTIISSYINSWSMVYSSYWWQFRVALKQ